MQKPFFAVISFNSFSHSLFQFLFHLFLHIDHNIVKYKREETEGKNNNKTFTPHAFVHFSCDQRKKSFMFIHTCWWFIYVWTCVCVCIVYLCICRITKRLSAFGPFYAIAFDLCCCFMERKGDNWWIRKICCFFFHFFVFSFLWSSFRQ